MIRLHCGTEPQLTGCLDAAGWRVVSGGRVCCPGCAAAHPSAGETDRVAVTVHDGETPRETTGERTACRQLVITVRRGEQGQWLGTVLTHRPTGRYLPLQGWTTHVGVLHRVAALVADLDWSSPDSAVYAAHVPRVLDAVNQALGERFDAANPGSEWLS